MFKSSSSDEVGSTINFSMGSTPGLRSGCLAHIWSVNLEEKKIFKNNFSKIIFQQRDVPGTSASLTKVSWHAGADWWSLSMSRPLKNGWSRIEL